MQLFQVRLERFVFSVLGSLGIGGVVRNLDVVAIRVGFICQGIGWWFCRVSGRLEGRLGRDSVFQERVRVRGRRYYVDGVFYSIVREWWGSQARYLVCIVCWFLNLLLLQFFECVFQSEIRGRSLEYFFSRYEGIFVVIIVEFLLRGGRGRKFLVVCGLVFIVVWRFNWRCVLSFFFGLIF